MLPEWADLFVQYDLIPHLVKMRLKQVLLEVVHHSSRRRFSGMYVIVCIILVFTH